MSSKIFLVIFLVALSTYPAVALVIRAKRRGYLRAAICFIAYFLIAFAGIVFLGLVQLQILPSGFSLLGGFLLVTFGAIFVVRGLKKKTDIDEMLMELNSSRFNPDRIFFEKFGESYFYIKSVLIGSGFLFAGVLSLLCKR